MEEELLKIPEEALLKSCRREVGELKSYIDELEYTNNTLEYTNNVLKKQIKELCDKKTKEKIQSQLLFKELHDKQVSLKNENKRLKNTNKELVEKLLKK